MCSFFQLFIMRFSTIHSSTVRYLPAITVAAHSFPSVGVPYLKFIVKNQGVYRYNVPLSYKKFVYSSSDMHWRSDDMDITRTPSPGTSGTCSILSGTVPVPPYPTEPCRAWPGTSAT